MSLNCQSIRGKTTYLKTIFEDHNIDVIVLQETWLNLGDKSIYAELRESDFKVSKLERIGKKGGGLATLIRSTITKKVSNFYNYTFEGFDNIVTTIKVDKKCYNIVNLYRPPSGSKAFFLKQFDKFLANIMEKEGIWVIMGDFNLDLLSKDKISIDFLYILKKYNLYQKVQNPTRKTALLDLVIIQSFNCDKSEILQPVIVFPSDHAPVFLSFTLNTPLQINNYEKREIRNYNNLDQDLFESKILKSTLKNQNIQDMDINDLVHVYNTTIKDIIDQVCPAKTRTFHRDQSKRWFNPSLNQLKKEKRRAERTFRKSKNEITLKNYKKAKSQYAIGLKQARSDFYSEKINKYKSDSKGLYTVLNELTGNKKERKLPTNFSETVTVEKIADFYVEKVLNIRQNILNSTKQKDEPEQTGPELITNQNRNSCSLDSFKEIDIDELKSIISSLKNKFCSLDPAPTIIIKNTLHLLSPILLTIINKSIQQCIFPDPLKQASITPIPKDPKLDPDNYKNLRTVSQIPFVAKILETVLHTQINTHIELNMLYPKFQSAYRQHHSCETALTRIVDDIQHSIYERKNVVLLLLDSSAAFDTVDQKLLLKKLENDYNIKDKALKMMNSYFQNRYFSTVINKTKSSARKLLHGVPQGSILGPLVYLLYTKNIENVVEKHGLKIHTYADDCQIYTSFYDHEKQQIEQKLRECLDEIQQWMSENFLKLNQEKTVIKFFGPQKFQTYDFKKLGDTSCGTIKVLGARISDGLQFTDFINDKVRKCNFHLRNLNNVKASLDISTKTLLVTNLILMTIDYCNILLIGATDRDLRPLKLIINRSIRFIYKLKYRTHITPYYLKAHFLPIRQRIKFKTSLTAYKIFNSESANYFEKDFVKFTPSSQMQLREGPGRDRFMFTTDPQNIETKTLISKIIKQWNSLPLEIRQCESKTTFKSKLKTFLFSEV